MKLKTGDIIIINNHNNGNPMFVHLKIIRQTKMDDFELKVVHCDNVADVGMIDHMSRKEIEEILKDSHCKIVQSEEEKRLLELLDAT